jgi:acyl CoA:acetate/3-ketoacid CoA transferase beta subunit
MGGRVELGTLTRGQINGHGNLNTLVIVGNASPDRPLAGAGCNTDIACLARRLIVLIPEEQRRWVERVDFVTSPGYLDGPGGSRRAGLGPQGA